jgi:hypothetical protein
MKILGHSEVGDNLMNTGGVAYLYDAEKYPIDYPSAGLYFKDELKDGGKALKSITYAPMSEYDVDGYLTWGQGAVNRIMTDMDFIPGDKVEGWDDPTLSLLKTQETVFITLPNATANVTRYYTYRDGKWISVGGSISQAPEETL